MLLNGKSGLSPSSRDLMKELSLIKHPEGGAFVETDRQLSEVPTPFADGAPRSLATSIYYMLSHDNPRGVIHMNKSVTYHVLHHGRAEYTLITPGNPPQIEKKIMGTDSDAGETRLLVVGTGVWKSSRLLPEDLDAAKTQEEKDRCLCLITEVVVPGFYWEDHKFMTRNDLEDLFYGIDGGEAYIKELSGSLAR
ncbi:RmlC-like cupin domain-containing protein [Mycena floridula]|nr:RmlC-like cupin domain-containing protein [Mycena floridula]